MPVMLPVFPLPICLFQQELLPLHIFEPRYDAMVRECISKGSGFVLLPVINGIRQEMGTVALVNRVVNRYSDGRADIIVEGLHTADILDYMPAKEQDHPDQVLCGPRLFDEDEDKELTLRTDDLLHEVLQLTDTAAQRRFSQGARIPDFVHKLGLSLEQEYELLQIEDYAGMQQMVLHWLKELFKHLSAAERMKKAIAMNGHFREFKTRD